MALQTKTQTVIQSSILEFLSELTLLSFHKLSHALLIFGTHSIPPYPLDLSYQKGG